MRTGTGTVKSFRGDPSLTVIGLERNGNTVLLPVDPALVDLLIERFGFRSKADFTSMEALIGLKVRWTENAVGMLVALDAMKN